MDKTDFKVTLSCGFHCRLLINGQEHLVVPGDAFYLSPEHDGPCSIIIELVQPLDVR